MTYILPRLPYERSALEPHSDARTMALHHENHSAFWFSLSPLGGGRPSGALATWNNITDSLFRAKDD